MDHLPLGENLTMNNGSDDELNHGRTSASSDDHNPYLVYIAGSFLVFNAINYLVGRCAPPFSSDDVTGNYTRWKWTNTMTSLIHSSLTGVWAVWAVARDPVLADDIVDGFSHSAHLLACVSLGYFLYDVIDMTLNTWPRRSTKEMLVHHLAVGVVFAVAASTRAYVSGIACALFVEVNSIFLHARTLLKMSSSKAAQGQDNQGFSYRAVALLNLLTYMVFRIMLFVWFTHKLATIRSKIPAVTFVVFVTAFVAVVVSSIVNLFRLIQSDFLRRGKSRKTTSSSSTGEACGNGGSYNKQKVTSFCKDSSATKKTSAISNTNNSKEFCHTE